MRHWMVTGIGVGLFLGGYVLFLEGGGGRQAVPGPASASRRGKSGPRSEKGADLGGKDGPRPAPSRREIGEGHRRGGALGVKVLVVKVLDGKGNPLPGVPVGLYLKDRSGKRVLQASLEERRVTDRKGEASFEDALSLLLENRRKKFEVHAGLAVLLRRGRFRTVRLDEKILGKAPPQVVLQAPGLGWVNVHSPAGSLIHGPGNVLFSLVPASLQVSSNWRGRRRWVFLEKWAFPPKSGIALLPVGLGLELEIWTLFPGLPPWPEKKIQGPVVAGQVVDVFLEPWNLSWLNARAVDEKDGILGGRDILVFLPRVRDPLLIDKEVLSRRWLRVKTDEKGVFRFPLPVRFEQFAYPRDKKEGFLQVFFQAGPGKGGEREGPPSRAVVEVPASRPEAFFLGDVRFHPPLHWIAVQLVGPGGRPVQRGKVSLSLSAKGSSWGPVFRKVTGRDGVCRFPVYTKEGFFRVSASREGFWNARTSARPLSNPKERVRLVLKPLHLPEGGRIAYKVLLGKEVLETPVYPKAVLDAVQTLPGRKRYGVGEIMNSLSLQGRSGILPPGIYRLEVRLGGFRGPVLRLGGIRVEKGKTTIDPRLNPLDLRPYLRAVSLEVVPPRNWKGRIYAPGLFLGKDGPGRFRFLITAEGPGKVLLRGPGIQDQWVDVSLPKVKVFLRKGIPLRLHLGGGMPPMPSWVKIGAREMPTCPLRFYMGDSFFQDLGRHYEEWKSTGGLGEFDGKGECLLLVGGPGKRRIQFFLAGRKSGHGIRCRILEDKVFSLPEGGAGRLSSRVSLDGRKVLQTLEKWKGE